MCPTGRKLRDDATAPAQGRSLPEIVAKLNDAIARAVATPSVQESLKRLGVEPKSSTPEAFAETIRTDLDKWSKVVKEANITLD
jgi:putative tricarboxylic transport membrane protein